jgi:membrane-associated protein
MSNMFNVTTIIQNGGYLLLGLFLYAEVGLFLGFFLPGDTLLIAAGIYAKQGKFNIAAVLLVAAVAAIAGDSTAYFIGKTIGPRLFTKKDSLLFEPKHVERAREFYEKHGAKTLLIAHFIPVIRTFSPPLAGIGNMPYKKFLLFDAIGDITWAVIVSLLGYYVGSRIPNIDHYILIVVAAVVVITLAPTLFHISRMLIKREQNKRNKTAKSKD